MDSLKKNFPCILCTEEFASKRSFKVHLEKCVETVVRELMYLQRTFSEKRVKFIQTGDETVMRDIRTLSSQCRSLEFRLQFSGFETNPPNGWISPYYSKFFANVPCDFCNQRFVSSTTMSRHRSSCFREAAWLKTTLYQRLQNAKRHLVTARELNGDCDTIEEEINDLEIHFNCLQSKLFTFEGLGMEEFVY